MWLKFGALMSKLTQENKFLLEPATKAEQAESHSETLTCGRIRQRRRNLARPQLSTGLSEGRELRALCFHDLRQRG